MTDRNTPNQLSLMYVFFCLFIIVTNLILSTMPEISSHSFMYRIISTIQILIACGVHGFAFAEGCNAGLNRESSSLKNIAGNIKSLVFPFVPALAVYWLVLYVAGEVEMKPIALVRIATGYHFYIIWILLQFRIISIFAGKALLKSNPFYSISIALIVSLLSVTLLPQKAHKLLFTSYLICYICGIYAGKHYPRVCSFVKTDFVKIVFFYVISLIITESVSIIYAFSSNVPDVIIKQIATGIYNPVAVIFIMALCIRLSDKSLCQNPVFKGLKGSTYYLFLWHMLPIALCSIILVDSEIVSKTGGFLIKTASLLVTVLAVLIPHYKKERKRNGTV